MIFLYFSLAIALIIGLYFLIELLVKFFENRKIYKKSAVEQIQEKELSLQQLQDKLGAMPRTDDESTIGLKEYSLDDIQRKLGVFNPSEAKKEQVSAELLPTKETLTMTYVRDERKKTVARSQPLKVIVTRPRADSSMSLSSRRRVEVIKPKLKVVAKSSKKQVAQGQNESLATVGAKSKTNTVIPDET